MENKILITIGNSDEIEFDSDNPDITKVINAFIKHRNDLNPKDIKVETNVIDFDKAGFEGLIQQVALDFLKAIKLNEEELKSAKDKLNKIKKI